MKTAGRKSNRGFTLIEILVVIAISMILMGLVLYPVAQSFKMTRSAQAMVDSQDAARHAMELISRDLGEALDIIQYDNEQPIQIPVLQHNGDVQYFDVPNAKIDFVQPKMLCHCNNPDHPSGKPRDFERGDEALPRCPECGSTDVEIRPKLPLEQDTKVIRYFLGLRYNNPNPSDTEPAFGWLSPWGKDVEADEGNQAVLYRVEFDPYDEDLVSDELPKELKDRYNGDLVLANLCDPQFFYRADTWQAWARKARVIGVAKYEDLVNGIDYKDDENYDALEPLVTFKFKKVENDIFDGTYATDQSFEYPDTTPAVYRGEYGYWMPNYDLALYRYTYGSDENAPESTAVYFVTTDGSGNLVIDKQVYGGSSASDFRQFNITQYNNIGHIVKDMNNSYLEMAFVPDPVRGTVNFALTPYRPKGAYSISDLDPGGINASFHREYAGDSSQAGDRGSARRYARLSTFVEYSDNYLKYATVVPGSERVVGPDMTPGPGYGSYVVYERVPYALGEPGYNQYRINYDTGYIFFSPIYDQDLPEIEGADGSLIPIRVDYKVHFNRKNDVVRGGYQTKSAVVVHLGMRMYDPESSKPHSVDLSNTIKVRNALR